MADLGLIDSKLGLYIKINVNNGQNKFEVHISKNVAKMAILWPKIGQRHFGARASHGHNLAIFHQILTNEHTKMTSSLRRIEWNTILSSISLFYILVFWPHFCSEASHGQCCTYGLKTSLKLLVHVLAIMASSYLKIVFQQKSGLNPPPPPLKGGGGGVVHPDFFCETWFRDKVVQQTRAREQTFEGFRTPSANRFPWDSHAHIWSIFGPIFYQITFTSSKSYFGVLYF